MYKKHRNHAFVFMKQSTKNASDPTFSPEIKGKDELLIQTFARLDCLALGIAIGVLFGAIIFLATNFLLLKSGDVIGPNLILINQYFFGYSVTLAGSFVGLIYGFGSGFITGWLLAFLRNSVIKIYLHFIKFKGRIAAIEFFLDN